MYKDAADALENMSGNELADMMERIMPEKHEELEGEEAASILQKVKHMKPIDEGHSLHVFSSKYDIDGIIYEVLGFFGSDEQTISRITKNDWSSLRNRDPQQLELF
jgi:excinuclease UvrABC nuclease subunit